MFRPLYPPKITISCDTRVEFRRTAKQKEIEMKTVVQKCDRCATKPTHGYPGETASACYEHKLVGMFIVNNKNKCVNCEKCSMRA